MLEKVACLLLIPRSRFAKSERQQPDVIRSISVWQQPEGEWAVGEKGLTSPLLNAGEVIGLIASMTMPVRLPLVHLLKRDPPKVDAIF